MPSSSLKVQLRQATKTPYHSSRAGDEDDEDTGLRVGFWVWCQRLGLEGMVEFVVPGDQDNPKAEVLVDVSTEEEREAIRTSPGYIALPGLVWVKVVDLQVTGRRARRTMRREVQEYADRLVACTQFARGVSKVDVAKAVGRSTKWVQRWWQEHPAMLKRPKDLEYLDTRGYRALQYKRRYARQPGLFQEVVNSTEWHQARVTSKRQLGGEKSGRYFHRPVWLCVCGREMRKVSRRGGGSLTPVQRGAARGPQPAAQPSPQRSAAQPSQRGAARQTHN